MKKDAKKIAVELVPFVKAYLVTKTNAQMWREKMEDWDRKELSSIEYHVDQKWKDRGRSLERITEPKDAWMMSESDFSDYQSERQVYIDSLNLGLETGYCPALVAEDLQRKAERLLLSNGCKLMNSDLTIDMLVRNMEAYHKAIELMCGMAVSTGLIKA